MSEGSGALGAPGTLGGRLSFYQVFWIFMICSVIGLAVETAVSYPIDGRWKDRAGLLWGPFSPIYGVGAVLLTVSLGRLSSARPAVQFAVSGLVGGAFELAAGWLLKNVFGIVAWSYIDQPFNIGGYTCLGIAIVWGLLGLAWVRAGLPVVLRIVELVPRRARPVLTAAACAFMVVDAAMTLAAFDCWFQRQAGLPVDTPVRAFFADRYGDAFMAERFQTMSLWADLAKR